MFKFKNSGVIITDRPDGRICFQNQIFVSLDFHSFPPVFFRFCAVLFEYEYEYEYIRVRVCEYVCTSFSVLWIFVFRTSQLDDRLVLVLLRFFSSIRTIYKVRSSNNTAVVVCTSRIIARTCWAVRICTYFCTISTLLPPGPDPTRI